MDLCRQTLHLLESMRVHAAYLQLRCRVEQRHETERLQQGTFYVSEGQKERVAAVFIFIGDRFLLRVVSCAF